MTQFQSLFSRECIQQSGTTLKLATGVGQPLYRHILYIDVLYAPIGAHDAKIFLED